MSDPTTTTAPPAPWPKAVEQQIADRLVELLNGHSFTLSFTAVRKYQVKVDLGTTKNLVVSVVVQGHERERSSRITNQHTYRVQVATQQKVDPADNDQCDRLAYLIQEMADFLDNDFAMSLDGARVSLIGDDSNPLWIPEHLLAYRQFTNVTTYTFTVERERSPS